MVLTRLNSLESQDLIAFIFIQFCLGNQAFTNGLTAISPLGGCAPSSSVAGLDSKSEQ